MFHRAIQKQIESRFFEGRIYTLWRSHQRQEVDYVEESENGLLAAEIKRKPGDGRLPRSFTEAYPEAQAHWIHPENLLDFIKERNFI